MPTNQICLPYSQKAALPLFVQKNVDNIISTTRLGIKITNSAIKVLITNDENSFSYYPIVKRDYKMDNNLLIFLKKNWFDAKEH